MNLLQLGRPGVVSDRHTEINLTDPQLTEWNVTPISCSGETLLILLPSFCRSFYGTCVVLGSVTVASRTRVKGR